MWQVSVYANIPLLLALAHLRPPGRRPYRPAAQSRTVPQAVSSTGEFPASSIPELTSEGPNLQVSGVRNQLAADSVKQSARGMQR